jgi:DNA/RNA endonuclease G (NUC1)
MKYTLLLIGILINSVLFSQNDTFVKRPSFEVLYSQQKKQPIRLKYVVVSKPCNATRKGMDFYTEKGIITSNNKDYAKNVWDKGHYAPAASFCESKELIHSTFSYLNCALQHYKLNRGPWKNLETQERVWAKSDSVTVIIETVYDEKPNLTPNGADIPDSFTKVIHIHATGEIRRYSFPNTECKGDFEAFRIK